VLDELPPLDNPAQPDDALHAQQLIEFDAVGEAAREAAQQAAQGQHEESALEHAAAQ